MTEGSRPVVLVTGAGGFIGWHVCRLLLSGGRYSVRPGVRRPESRGALDRLGLEPVACDVKRPRQIERALDGVRYVVNCAKGRAWGLRHLLERAHGRDIRRIVHLSSVAAYAAQDGRLAEDAPLHRTGPGYAGWKAHAERIALQHVEKGLPVAILRPTIVYGPLSRNWTRGLARALVNGGWPIPRRFCNGKCNAVYVEDVVQAVERAFESDAAVGQAFNVNGDERLSWNDYLDALAGALGLPEVPYSPRWTAVLGRLPEGIWRRLPLVSMLSQEPDFPIDKARRLIGYAPRFTLAQGMAATRPWLEEQALRS